MFSENLIENLTSSSWLFLASIGLNIASSTDLTDPDLGRLIFTTWLKLVYYAEKRYHD